MRITKDLKYVWRSSKRQALEIAKKLKKEYKIVEIKLTNSGAFGPIYHVYYGKYKGGINEGKK